MARKRTMVGDPPQEAVVVAAEKGFDKAPEFKVDDTPETDEDDSGDFGC